MQKKTLSTRACIEPLGAHVILKITIVVSVTFRIVFDVEFVNAACRIDYGSSPADKKSRFCFY